MSQMGVGDKRLLHLLAGSIYSIPVTGQAPARRWETVPRRQTWSPPTGGSYLARGAVTGSSGFWGDSITPTSASGSCRLGRTCVPGCRVVPTALCFIALSMSLPPPAPHSLGTTVCQAPRGGHGKEQGVACSPWVTPSGAERCPPAHPVPPGPTRGRELVTTYVARWHRESRLLHSSSARRRASLPPAFCREPWPCSQGSPGAWATIPRPWAVALPGPEL